MGKFDLRPGSFSPLLADSPAPRGRGPGASASVGQERPHPRARVRVDSAGSGAIAPFPPDTQPREPALKARTSCRLPFWLPLALAGCIPDGGSVSSDFAWDPAVLAARDGVYVRLPAAGRLVRVQTDGSSAEVDLNGASPDTLTLVPGGDTVLVHASWPICDTTHKNVKYVSDCPDDDLSYGHELDLVQDGVVVGTTTEVPHQFNAMTFNADASLAVAFLDFESSDEIDVSGVLNLTEAVFIDMGNAEVHRVPVGFAPENVLFTASGDRAVVLSRSQVAVVDLGTWAVVVTYPLTLDADQQVTPTDVALTPDGSYALVTTYGSEDLYVLDLVAESIDIVELDGVPSDLMVDTANDRTLIVYGNTAQVDVLEHAYFETEAFELDEPCSAIAAAGSDSLLFNPNSNYHDVYRFNVATGSLDEYRAENPVEEMFISADNTTAVATTRPESGGGGASGFYDDYYGLNVFDLVNDSTPAALALESEPVGVQLISTDGVNAAFVLLNGLDELVQVDLATGSSSSLELPAPPVGITAIPDGPFVVSHQSALGLISFYDVASDSFVTASNFATLGLYGERELPRTEVSE